MLASRSGKARRRLGLLVAAACILLSLVSMVVSLGAPGIGWMIAAAILIIATFMTPLIGRLKLGICFVITVIHLFTFGPMSLLGLTFTLDPGFIFLFALTPLLVALASLLRPLSQRRKTKTRSGR
ncbi:hypothetical protein INH39_00870 [Massilia violaceinigra]|uniref:Uncharacterized protein n=1 Tax=Massilia violaceinigra TaxID=2045208 RepID=A0ABY4A6R5_9BURK|nr:hypothetical protein [Massilia violaceinigra]UOD30342.1 hypothetical protein INH39_00870 [Massilia violaceinigra]